MQAEIVGDDVGNQKLVITIPLEKPKPSATGKNLVVASSRGNQTTTAVVDGQPVVVGFNAYIKKQG